MPTVIDSLVVQLGFDTKGMSAGRKEADTQFKAVRDEAGKTAKEMDAMGQQASAFFSRIKFEALGLLGVLTGASSIGAMIGNASERLGTLGDQARNIGRAVPELDALRNAIGRNGGSAEQAGRSFVQLADAMQRFKTLGEGPTNMYGPLGIQRGDDALTAYQKYFNYVKAHPLDVRGARQFGQGIGLDEGTINATLRMVAKGTDLNTEQARSEHLGLATKEMTDQMVAYQEAIAGVQQAALHASEVLVSHLIPGLTAFLKQITEDLVKLPNLSRKDIEQINPDVTKAVNDPIQGIKDFFTSLFTKNADNVNALTGEDKPPAGWKEGDELPKIHSSIVEGLKEGFLSIKDMWSRTTSGAAEAFWAGHDALQGATGIGFSPGTRAGLGGPRVAAWAPNTDQRKKAEAESMAFWVSQGLTTAQAAGMAAQEMHESGGNPGARGDPEGGVMKAHGLYQWHPDRRAKILAGTGIDVSTASAADQRKAAAWELKNRETAAWRQLQGAATPNAAGVAGTGFERPGNRAGEEIARGQTAEGIARRYKPAGPIVETKPEEPKPINGLTDAQADQILKDRKTDPYAIDPSFNTPAANVPAVGPQSSNDNNSTVHVGTINVHTQANDARGIAKEIHTALSDQIINNANRGLT